MTEDIDDVEPSVSSVESRETDISSGFLCQICGETYRNPTILPNCGHTFCEDCIPRLTNSRNGIVCLECQVVSRSKPSDLKANKVLAKIIDVLKQNHVRLGNMTGFDVMALNSEVVQLRKERDNRNADFLRMSIKVKDLVGQLNLANEKIAELSGKFEQGDEAPPNPVKQYCQKFEGEELKEQAKLFNDLLQDASKSQEDNCRQIMDRLALLNEKLVHVERSSSKQEPGFNPVKVEQLLQSLNAAKSGLNDFFERHVATFERELGRVRREKDELQLEVEKKNAFVSKLMFRLRTTTKESILLLEQLSEEHQKLVTQDEVIEEFEREAIGNFKRMKKVLSSKQK